MTRSFARACLATALLTASASTLAAEGDDRAWSWANGAAVSTETVWRGQSLTAGKPAVIGELKLDHHSGAYVGVWAGNIDLGPRTDTHVEFDYFAGWARKTGKVYVNAGYLYRQRPSDTMSLDFEELTLSASYDFGPVVVGVSGAYAWDYFQGGSSLYTSANVRVPLGKPYGIPVSAVLTVGEYDFSSHAIGDYRNADLRLTARHRNWYYSVGYGDTDIDPETSGLLTRHQSDGRWRAQALVMF
ncbi:MAG: hypothetical protein DI562_02365 [Stenotrophomonas acidaminiphila]|nr:MAG: hypothetical protein DI562_02365 [Stenotrophomonas acidaminiphila]